MTDRRKKRFYLKELYNISPLEHVPSILDRGILSREMAEQNEAICKDVAEPGIVDRRRTKTAPNGRRLSSYANLYFQPKNAMLLKLISVSGINVENLVIFGVDKSVTRLPGVWISDSNAATEASSLCPVSKIENVLEKCSQALAGDSWEPETKSVRMAECLVPDRIPPEYIKCAYVSSIEAMKRLDSLLAVAASSKIQVIPNSRMFFQSSLCVPITDTLEVRDGDLFFSDMQTLTVSVNCVGVMGAGVASTAKYMFPEVHTAYVNLCDKSVLQLGKPYLLKREEGGYELADLPEMPNSKNGSTWFLLFPTKYHWRERASLEGIREGLRWLVDNYEEERIQSIALPALGCGKGWQDWSTVWPILRDHLERLSIPVQVYIPMEREIPKEQLTKEFLMR